MRKTKNENQLKKAKLLLEKLIKLLDLEANVEGKFEDETIHLTVSTDNSALLIGYHGKTLSSLQTILGAIAYKKFGKTRIIVDVGGWRQRRDQTIIQIAQTAAERAKSAGIPQPIYNLTPYERRIVHMTLAQDSDVKTESQGEGSSRYLMVKPLSSKSND